MISNPPSSAAATTAGGDADRAGVALPRICPEAPVPRFAVRHSSSRLLIASTTDIGRLRYSHAFLRCSGRLITMTGSLHTVARKAVVLTGMAAIRNAPSCTVSLFNKLFNQCSETSCISVSKPARWR